MTAPLANVLRHISKLVGRSTTVGLSDGEILERFVSRRDEAAFEELLARHGPMVWGVCQQLLRDPHDAEDAFQATFLVLVRRAASIGQRERLAGWLYGVAHRVAWRARAQTARRQAREKRGMEMAAVEPPGPLPWDDVRPVVHEEVNRLPDKYRTPVVLCYLEGKTQEEAAKDLGWTKGVVKGRLERARDLLRKRLLRRGVTLSAGALSAVCPSATAVPPALVSATVKAATLLVAGQGLAAGAVSTQAISLMEGVLRIMFLTKLKILSAVLVVAGLVGAGVAVSAYHSLAAEPAGGNKLDNSKQASRDDPPAEARPEKVPADRNQAEAPRRKVQVMRPILGKVTNYQDYTGQTEAPKVEVFAQVSGALANIFFHAGTEVKKGQPLFGLDSRQYEVELDKANAELTRAESRLKYASAQLERARKHLATNTISREDFDRIAADHEDAQSAVQAAKASETLAQLHLASTKIMAPINGQIGRPLVTPGGYVRAGTTLLTTIVAAEPMYIDFEIDAATFLALQRQAREGNIKLLGATVLISLGEKDFPHRGTIDFVGNQVRPETGTLPVRAVITKPDRFLIPGLQARIRLAVNEHAGLLVPDEAVVLQDRNGELSLLVATDRNVVERRKVKLGDEENGLRLIKEGLRAGDWVIIKDLKELEPGMEIEPERVSERKPPEE
jgi:RND family efflux transporter MFP subunit